MKNLFWILAGAAAGYYLAKKTSGKQVPGTTMKLPGGAVIPNSGLAPAPGVGACPGHTRSPFTYLNCNSQAVAKMTL